MAEFDLSQLNEGRKQNTSTDRIDTTSGKIQRSGQYISANEAKAKGIVPGSKKDSYDPIFDTPPTFKPERQSSNIQSLDEKSGSMAGRTPVIHSKKDKMDVEDPVPLKVVDNFARKFNEVSEKEELQPFDPHSLPKKKEEMGDAEAEDMAKLDVAVKREMESISQRMKELTDAQYNELIEAREKGIKITPPMTDEEVAAQEEKEVNQESKNENSEDSIQKRIIIDGDDGEEISVEDSDSQKTFEENCMNAIRYVDNHVNAKDYFTRTMHLKSYLAKMHQYSEIWAIVMYNKEGETVVHPFLVTKKNNITAIVECNLDNIKGMHILDPNDTIEGLYVEFQHKGYLYEYIDYLANAVVVKLPSDMPTIENAVKLANEKLGETNHMNEEIKPTETSKIDKTVPIEKSDDADDILKDAINHEEANELYGNTSTYTTEEKYDTSNDHVVNIVYADDDTDMTSTETVPSSNYAPIEEHVETSSIDEPSTTETDDSEEDHVVISKEYEGKQAYNEAISDDLEKDLEKELNIDVDEDKTNEEMLNELRDAVKKNIPAIKQRINLRDFKISKTPISAAQVASFTISDLNEADWVLPNAQRVITVRGLSGPELFAMNPQNSNKNKINTFRQIYGIIYKHIVSVKPNTFDEWLKVTRFSDIDHIYAALHRATFAGSNFVHYECPECHHVFVREYPFEDMVQYRDDDAKKKITQLLNSADSSIPGYDVRLVQISDKYVVGLKDPSIWNMVMETAALSESFLSKYEDLLDTMSFIDSIYVIDRESKSLSPIDFDYKKDEPAQSTARKIIILSDLIKSLSSDSYFNLRNQIAQMFASSNDISYKIPAAECDKCGHKFAEEPTEGMRMLFTRHQLGALGVI